MASTQEKVRHLPSAIFLVFLFDYFFLGGGRLVEFNGITLRIILLCYGLLYSFSLILLKRSQPDVVFQLILGASFLTLISIIVGLTNSNFDLGQLGLDLRMYSGLWIGPFLFYFVITKKSVYRAFYWLIRNAGFYIAIVHILTLSALYLGKIEYSSFYNYFYETEELVFRQFPFFYFKGFILLPVSTMMLIVLGGKYKVFKLFVVTTSVILAFTRGLYVIFILALLFSVWKKYKVLTLTILFALLAILLSESGFFIEIYNEYFGDRDLSNSTRFSDSKAFGGRPLWRIILGEGLGVSFNGRANVENSYLWIVVKFGLTGLTMTLLYLIHLVARLYTYYKRTDSLEVYAYAGVIIILCVQSVFNPYLTNNIGILMVLFVEAAFRRKRKIYG